jgi:hypothetical protein
MTQGYDPYHLASPTVYLIKILIFLVIVGLVGAILANTVLAFFWANPFINSLIFFTLFTGIFLSFRQIYRLFPEVKWVNSLQDGNVTSVRPPILLAPVAGLLRERIGEAIITPSSMRSILDSVGNRLDEAKDTSRYLTGLLVFLGLMGTFYGLLQTVTSVAGVINALDVTAGDTASLFANLKNGLTAPLEGMGTAFSSSLFGLAGSLVLGFLDLQSGRAQTRFYTELENWLSSVTDLSSDIVVAEAPRGASADEINALADKLRSMQESGGSSPRVATAMANLADGISGLVKNMRSEQQIMRDWVEAQSQEQKALRTTLDRIAEALKKREMN